MYENKVKKNVVKKEANTVRRSLLVITRDGLTCPRLREEEGVEEEAGLSF